MLVTSYVTGVRDVIEVSDDIGVSDVIEVSDAIRV